MIKQFLIKNWIWVIAFGLMAFFLFEESRKSAEKDLIIDSIIEKHDQDKLGIDTVLDSLSEVYKIQNKKVKEANDRYKIIENKLKEIQDERIKNSNSVPSHSDAELDSILTNYRHR